MMKPYTIDVLSPVHVGTGETLTPLEFIAGERFAVFDTHAFFTARPDRAEVFTAKLSRTPANQIASLRLGELLVGDETSNRDYWAYSAWLDGVVRAALREDNRSEVRHAIKTPDFRPYIPATSIKGAIRTAIAYFEYRENTELLCRLIPKAGDRDAHGQIQRQIFISMRGNDATNDYLRALSISDPQPVSAEDHLMLAWGRVLSAPIAFSGSRTPTGRDEFKRYSIFSEAIQPNATLSGRLSLNQDLLTSARASAIMRWTPHQSALSIEDICRAVNTFAADICAWELDYFRQVESIDCKSIVRFYEGLSERVAAAQERSDTLFLSIGQGSGWHKMTVGLLLEKAVREGGMDKGQFDRIRTGTARYRQEFQYPKSRKVAVRGKEGVWLPFGWVALRLPDAPPVPKLVDMAALMAEQRAEPEPRRGPSGFSGRSERPSGTRPREQRPQTRFEAPPRRAEPLPVVPKPPPRPEPKPSSGPQHRVGDEIGVEIVSNDSRVVRVRLPGGDGKEINVQQAYYPHKAGAKRKARVMSVDATGKVKEVRLS